MFFFVRDSFVTSDGITYLVEFARVERPFAFWEAEEAHRITSRDLAIIKAILYFEVVTILATVLVAIGKIK